MHALGTNKHKANELFLGPNCEVHLPIRPNLFLYYFLFQLETSMQYRQAYKLGNYICSDMSLQKNCTKKHHCFEVAIEVDMR